MNGRTAMGARARPGGGRAGERRWAPALLLLFAGFYLLTASGHFYAVDEETIYAVTASLVERHTFALQEQWGLVAGRGPDGRLYAQYAPGQSLLAVPLYLAGRALAPEFPAEQRDYVTRFAVSLFNPLVTAATVALLYLLARALGYGRRAALGLAAIYGLATGAWPHGRTFFAEPLTALCLLAAFYAMVRSGASRRAPGWLVASGAAAAGAVAVKPQAAIALPVLGLYLLGTAALGAGDGESRWDGHAIAPRTQDSGLRTQWVRDRAMLSPSSGLLSPESSVLSPSIARRLVAAALPWAAGLLLIALPYALYNAALYGSPLRTGYGTDRLFTTPFLTGLAGLTISSGKGLLWYSPPVALAALGWWPFSRRHRAEALACLGMLTVHLAFYSRLSFWHGDGSWGPRYLMIALPFVMLPLVALLAGPGARRWRRARLALVTAVAALGLAVQLLGVTVNFDWYLLRTGDIDHYFTPANSPLLAHARTLVARAREWRARATPPPDTAFLTGGFSYSEAPRGGDALFPRWTTGDGEIALHTAVATEPVLVKLTFFDHRPPALRKQRATVLVDGAPLPAGAVEERDFSGDGTGWIYQFIVPAAAFTDRAATVTLHSATWNPRASGEGARDEDLGVYVHDVEVWRAGRPWPVREALAIPPLPTTPHLQFWWFNDDSTRHHLADLWWWYAAAAGFGEPLTALWIAGYAAAAGGLALAGLLLLPRALPAGTLARPRRPARPLVEVRDEK
ncbi:MAG TPA: phospholipid carrier-dependent glycosyltransferase [Thermomicrobiales bacterium]|nr:phospholipid carrier-dependent glycosyltransferase [Thermomicrobiales bacterium]